MPGAAYDVGASKTGAVWVIGTNHAGWGGYGIYKWNGSNWTNVPGAAMRVCVSGNSPWVVNARHMIYRMGSNNQFELMPGRAIDIGCGSDGSVWATGYPAQ